ncbi:TonB-dependent receptor [Hymenobacter algoricola]|uniref:TonB-dependent receptor n=1 Tax=Hymenobacter algoricola TaxID=486267 RepID=A0ABP7N761_9BACT
MKHSVLTFLLTCLVVLTAAAQSTFSIKGRVLDKLTGEALPGATVQVTGNGINTGAGAEANGSYIVPNLKPGTYSVKASFIGYKLTEQKVTVGTQNAMATFSLASDNATLNEVQVIASVAVERETPVAFAAVNEVKLRETLSNRDLPLILNETPGVYATQGGGGTGDSRINIRGFDQRNVAVLINGVPVNDMENGAVYWSNWDLGDVTKSLQVQRGLSASKISVPAVGGTINVLTRGFDDKKSLLARVETGSNNYQKYSLMLSSGPLKGDWAFTAFGSRRTSDGWVDHAFDDAWTYFGNISKKAGKHRLSLTGMGSPQSHGQRAFQVPVGAYSDEKIRLIGGKPITNGNKGFQYNPNWGPLTRYAYDPLTHTRSNFQPSEDLNERSNYYNKPQVNLNDFWQVNDRLFVSSVVYGSFGNGGGVSGLTDGNSSTILQNSVTGQTDFQRIYNFNVRNYPYTLVRRTGTTINDTIFTPGTEAKSTQFLINNVNSHRWYGFVVGADYNLNDKLTLSAGIDGRSYYGIHYREVRDLLGGDYTTNTGNKNVDPNTRLRVGDKLSYNYDGKTRWLGGYSQLEYKTPVLSAVISATVSEVGYKRIDYFKAKEVTVDGVNYPVPFAGPGVIVNGEGYTNAAGHTVETSWARYTGFSVKAGANYNISEHDNLFVNVGYNQKVPFFNFVYANSGYKYADVKPEGISSVEMGYGITYPSMKATLNAYYTLWGNKSTTFTTNPDQTLLYNNVRNVNARHAGVELSVAQDISRRVQLSAAIALGDWRWTGQGLLTKTTESGEVVGMVDQPVYLAGTHVGDAAQTQFQLGLRYEPFKRAYIRPSFLLFSKYYADFNPENLVNPDTRTDSYRLPTTRNLDLHFGYDFPKVAKDRLRLGLKASVLNVLNEYYFTDVSNRSNSNVIDPAQQQAFFNRGRTFTIGLSAAL